MWNICTHPTNPTILIAIGEAVPAGYTIEAQTSNPNYLTDSAIVPAGRKITVLAFRNRFTKTEKIMIEMASLDDPSGTIQQRQLAAALRVDMQDSNSAAFIDLDRPDTRAGITTLETYQLIATGRATQILDAPVLDVEMPQSHVY